MQNNQTSGPIFRQELLVPNDDISAVELSIVIPAANEEATIGTFMDWCIEGIKKIDVKAEVLIVDSSTDDTAKIALAKGARVLKVPKLGLGRAYIDAIPYIRGKYVLLGDCDCTYDFRELKPFVDCFENGFEFIMGSRFAGSIETGAMPPLHRYFGSPLTNWFLNFIYGQKFTDIHCGMRGVTLASLKRMDLQSQSWQYASEMILKSIHMGLKTTEIPIHFYKDRNGRQSHFKRQGFWSSWYAGWISLKVMLIYRADFFLFYPGIIFLLAGIALVLFLFNGPKQIGGIGLSLWWEVLGAFLFVLGAHLFYTSIIARLLYDYDGTTTKKWLHIFSFNRSILASSLLAALGLCAIIPFISEYIANGYLFANGNPNSGYITLAGIVLIVFSFINFTSTLMIHALSQYQSTKMKILQ